MGDIANEPSMEDILSSIKRIIAEDADTSAATARARAAARRKAAPAPVISEEPEDEDEVLELTEAVAEADAYAEEEPEPMKEIAEDPELVSERVAKASRQSLESLSSLIVKPEAGSNTLEGLVREMLRPMLSEWLDANLPAVVERMVSREIRRITGKDL
jgi:cell pole-organizing protein PopZ